MCLSAKDSMYEMERVDVERWISGRGAFSQRESTDRARRKEIFKEQIKAPIHPELTLFVCVYFFVR